LVATSKLLERVVNVISDFPSPEQVMSLRTTQEEESRLDELAAKNAAGKLTISERLELEHYLIAEHMVRMAKTNAFSRLKGA